MAACGRQCHSARWVRLYGCDDKIQQNGSVDRHLYCQSAFHLDNEPLVSQRAILDEREGHWSCYLCSDLFEKCGVIYRSNLFRSELIFCTEELLR